MSDKTASQTNDWSTFFFRDNRAMLLLLGVVAVAGLTSIAVLPRMEDPVLSARVGLVATRMPGADAKRVENLITEPLEDRLQDVEEVKEIVSESRPGISTITVVLRDDIYDTDEVWSEIRGKIEDAITVLPPQASRPVFEELDVRAYALIVAVKWQRDDPPSWTLLRRYAKRLEDKLLAIKGTEVIERFADPGEEATVVIDPDQAAALGLDATSVAKQLSGSDAKGSVGFLRTTDQQLIMEMANQFEQSGRIADALIQSDGGGSMVRIGDIATITRGCPDPLPRFAMIDDRPSVALGVMVRKAQRIDLWRSDVQAALDDFADDLPTGLTIDLVLDQNKYVSQRLSSLASNLFVGVIAVVLVVLALMGWRSAIVVALALPLSGFTALFGLRLLQVPIHQMSITGMIIAIGLLIDNAIVAVDEVVTEMRSGRSPIEAVRASVRHLAIPLFGSTITTALAFAPIAMMPGPAGEFVGAIAISVILAISASLFFSLTVIPVVASKFVGRAPDERRKGNLLQRFLRNGFQSQTVGQRYRRVLEWLLEKPFRAIAVSAVLPIIGFGLFSQLSEQFFPAADRDQFHVELELPADATVAATQRASMAINPLLVDAGAKKISWFYGESAPVFYYNILGSRRGVANFGSAIVQMDSPDGLRDTLRSLQQSADAAVPGARVLMRQLEQGPPFNAPIEIRLFGPDLVRLQELGDEVRIALASVRDVTHTKSLLSETLPTVSLDVDEAAARLVGIQPADISTQLYGQLEGALAGQILEDTEQIPVRVRVGNERRGELSQIATMQLTTPSGLVPLASVADITIEPEIAVIPRRDRRRMNQVAGFISAGTLPADSLLEFQDRLARSGFQLPPGYELEYGGEASQRNDAVGNLMANVGVLMVMMIATLVLSFRSFRLAAVIMVVAVGSIGLGMIGLWIGGYPFGFMAIIGTMGLVGVAINDSIVVLASLREHEAGGRLSLDETVDVVYRCTRHVVATTLTTIAGFAPLIISGGKFWPPLAIAIAGGVSGATLMALCFVPATYRMLRKSERVATCVFVVRRPEHQDSPDPDIAASLLSHRAQ
ncbi:Swarming motility protein SwrC [Rubripirellula tenax]|uniref:Swarming motility protein SwrC n=1 Tax=Rubripirellula tenax TaxID=2528015 RepID=A0A5C6FBT5_9BACT|nr:efflux RND transporter permease subunit [Rubripirellula tenax]TWU58905.1 Swarming motility protein SwrC [Rubripirellula tenax]